MLQRLYPWKPNRADDNEEEVDNDAFELNTDFEDED